jgi:Ala-tRNA(Pro) deacylase
VLVSFAPGERKQHISAVIEISGRKGQQELTPTARLFRQTVEKIYLRQEITENFKISISTYAAHKNKTACPTYFYGETDMDKKTETLQWLNRNGVRYELVEHKAVFTIEEMDAVGVAQYGCVAKNLFLRDAKGKRHFLVSLVGHKSADLRALGERLGVKLSFASEQRLQQYLNLSKGSVTPLGVLYDRKAAVEVILDAELSEQTRVGVHPCVNTASVFMAYPDLERLLRENGNKVTVLQL